ncbi:MAG: ArsR/SmtB family transcription factor [Dehalococcoidia bacterium]
MAIVWELAGIHPREDPRLSVTARFFRILGDPTRLRILELLLDGEKTVTELVEAIGSAQGRVSSHLACLRWCGLIDTRRQGKYIFYQATNERVRQLLPLAQAMIAENAEAVWSCTRVDTT